MSKKVFTITDMNKALFLIFLLIFGYCLYDLVVNVLPGFKDFTDIKITIPVKKSKEVKNQRASKPLDYYIQAIGSKGLFKASADDSLNAGNNLTQAEFTNTLLAEQARALVLKGIIEGETLQAVIEDTKAAKTFFVVKNDKIGDIIVDDITPNKVKLRLGEQVIDLTL